MPAPDINIYKIIMRKFYNSAALMICMLGCSVATFAGNKDRSGQAGATQLLINPWGQSTGVFGMNTSYVTGVDAMKTNVAGLGRVSKTEVGFAHSRYLAGTGVSVNNLGFAQRIGNIGVIGANVMSVGFGEVIITDYDNPEGGIGTYNPQFYNVMIGYAKEFSKNISAGAGATFVNEQIPDASATGSVFEAGIQYVTGTRDNYHFGITLRNIGIGSGMRYTGSGFAINSEAPEDGSYSLNRQIPSEQFEMPTYLNIGMSYDFYLDENRISPEDVQSSEEFVPKHRLTVMGNFTSNSFNNDYIGGAVEYAFQEIIMLRGGYRYENKIGDAELSTTFYTGLCAGATVQFRAGETGPQFALDYSYRSTRQPNNGIHTFSLRLMR